jgi:threonylcarbamoyladenosine tRNA methylthiotransferase MtaB
VFTYSARPGTPAAEHQGQVPVNTARARNRVLREIASAKKAAFMRSLVGTTVEAITLHSGGAEFTEALTENYLKVKVFGQHEENRWGDVHIEAVDGEMLLGKLETPGVPPRPDGYGHCRCGHCHGDSGVHLSEQTH